MVTVTSTCLKQANSALSAHLVLGGGLLRKKWCVILPSFLCVIPNLHASSPPLFSPHGKGLGKTLEIVALVAAEKHAALSSSSCSSSSSSSASKKPALASSASLLPSETEWKRELNFRQPKVKKPLILNAEDDNTRPVLTSVCFFFLPSLLPPTIHIHLHRRR